MRAIPAATAKWLALALCATLGLADPPLASRLFAADAAAGDIFGRSAAVSRDTIVVGASLDDAAAGAAYVFTRNGTTWARQTKLTGAGAGDVLGFAVAIDGDTVVAGAPFADSQAGAVHVFEDTIALCRIEVL